MKTFIGSLFLLIFTSSCTGWQGKEVTITKDYVINPYWDEGDNAFAVHRMKSKDSGKVINFKHTSEPELYNELVKDTSFSYTGFVESNGVDYAQRKVYFNKDNGFLWLKNFPISNSKTKVLGELQQETWYLLTGLSNARTLYYIYIDKSDRLHVSKVSTMTNY